MPYDKTKPYSCPCCGYWNGDMKYDYYKHQKPLIKDEKIRKAVRAWADVIGAEDADIVRQYGAERWMGLRFEHPNTGWVSKFEIDGFGSMNNLENEKIYTIAELCGEEEE